ncbi:hypothetical protein O6B72_02185 [Campylobacter ureolyticus]|uniref:hypothetical protein n=1 Tax=Campylobacter ureolyticus TaxID=827 RepID=UPI0022B3A72B|nr:hypothetical protein [Campylobacter ureolyticus]MCZ6155628.1 hypothetical protein [Campylobacter ureolyticus]
MLTSYKNSIYSEYVCSKIIKELGLKVQNVLIGLSISADGKQREIAIEKARDSAIDMFGEIKGIAGESVASVESLEIENILELKDE